MNSSFSKDARFDAVFTNTIENIDRTQRRMHHANLAGQEHISLVKNFTLLSDPAAKLIRMNVHVFSDSPWCVGVSNPEPSNNWATKFEDVWPEHTFVEKLNWASREMQYSWRVLLGAATDIKKHIREYLNSEPPESFDEGIIFLSMFNVSILSYV